MRRIRGMSTRQAVGVRFGRMTINLTALVLAFVGALVFVFVSHPAAKEMGRISFFVGLFWVAAHVAAGTITIR